VPETIEEHLKSILVDRLDVPIHAVVLEADVVKDLMADSLDIAEIIMHIEDDFGIRMPEEHALFHDALTVRRLLDVVTTCIRDNGYPSPSRAHRNPL
jgi:acyl carrier protein